MNLTATMRMLAMSLLLALIVLPAFNISVCAVEEGQLGETSTNAPTGFPTTQPTPATDAPTGFPTTQPTPATDAPTAVATSAPTLAPTEAGAIPTVAVSLVLGGSVDVRAAVLQVLIEKIQSRANVTASVTASTNGTTSPTASPTASNGATTDPATEPATEPSRRVRRTTMLEKLKKHAALSSRRRLAGALCADPAQTTNITFVLPGFDNKALIDEYLVDLLAGATTLTVGTVSATDALCNYATALSYAVPLMPLDDKATDADAEADGGLPAGYIVVAVIGSVLGLIAVAAVYARFQKAARRRVR